MKLTELIIIICTVPNNQSIVRNIINCLITQKLAACITSINQCASYYFWNDSMTKQKEIQLIIKSHIFLKRNIIKKITEIHPYQIPELLIIPVIDAEKKFQSWILNNIHLPYKTLNKYSTDK